MYRPNILLTAFGAFPGVECNPTEIVLEKCIELEVDSSAFQLTRAVLDVSYHRSIEQLYELLNEHEAFDIVIHLGVAISSDEIRLERQAINQRSAKIPDIDGVKSNEVPIMARLPIEYIVQTTSPLEALEQKLKKKGIPVRISQDAGKYVCNNIYFASLLWQKNAIFVHIPAFGEYWTSALLTQIVSDIVQELCSITQV